MASVGQKFVSFGQFSCKNSTEFSDSSPDLSNLSSRKSTVLLNSKYSFAHDFIALQGVLVWYIAF